MLGDVSSVGDDSKAGEQGERTHPVLVGLPQTRKACVFSEHLSQLHRIFYTDRVVQPVRVWT